MPLLLSWPALVPSRAEPLHALVSHLDLVPTMLDAANVPPTMRTLLPPERRAAPADAEPASDAGGGGGRAWAAAGLPAPPAAAGGPAWRHPGRSLAPLLVDVVVKGIYEQEPQVHSHLYCEVGQMRAVFNEGWRLIYAPQIKPIAKGGTTNMKTNYGVNKHHSAYWRPLQLYNLLKDPTEQVNLINETSAAGELAKLRDLLQSHMTDACRSGEWDV